MKEPIYNSLERYQIRNIESTLTAYRKLNIAVLHFRREIYRSFVKYLKNQKLQNFIESLSYKPTGQVLLNLFGVSFCIWDYGTCNDRPARKHKIKGNVQFVLWKAGEQGHKKDYWHNFDSSWWVQFKKY